MQQLSLTFEPGLSSRYRSLREVMAQGVYQRGLTHVAGKCDMQPSKLSEKLSGGNDRPRDVGLEEFERYLQTTGDMQPIYYLVDRYLRDPAVLQQEATARLVALAEQLEPLMRMAGLAGAEAKRGRR